MVKLLTFDLDNTLWPVNEVIERANNKMMSWLSHQHPQILQSVSHQDFFTIREQLIKQDPNLIANLSALRTQTIAEAALRAGVANAEAQDLAQQAFTVFHEERNKVSPFPSAHEVLEQLAKDFQLISLTNGNADIKKIDIGQHFHRSISSEEAGAAKPEPKMFLMALDHAKVNPEECIHIGDDRVCDIEPAKKLGMKTVWANLIDYPPMEDSPADAEIKSLDELPSIIDKLIP